jgi:hypothetical protein
MREGDRSGGWPIGLQFSTRPGFQRSRRNKADRFPFHPKGLTRFAKLKNGLAKR